MWRLALHHEKQRFNSKDKIFPARNEQKILFMMLSKIDQAP